MRRFCPRIGGHLCLSVALLALGCNDLGAGGTGEYVVSPQRTREIESIELDDLPSIGPATTQPFILSTTMPSSGQPWTAGSIGGGNGTRQITEQPITLADVRRQAIENNLRLKVDLLDPTIARQRITEEQARFEAVFTVDPRYFNNDNPFLSQQNGETILRSTKVEGFDVLPNLQIPLISGGTISLTAPIDRAETTSGGIDPNTGFPTSQKEWRSNFTFNFNQPLLRGGGLDANLASIRIAFYQFQQTEARTKLAVITVLSDADRQYWRLDGAIKLLEVQKERYDFAADQLGRARRRLDAGAGVPADVVSAEAAVADAALSIVTAESAVRAELRELKRIMNAPDLDLNSPILLRPTGDPRFLSSRLNADELAEQAVHDRMEILEAELAIIEQSTRVKLARNDVLPFLDVFYRYNAHGVGTTFNDSFDVLTENDFGDHSAGLRLQFPIGNQAARSRLRASLAQRQQALATRNLREQSVRAEVYLAVQNLEQTWQAILAARQRVFAETRVLESEIRKFDRGENDSEDVRLARDRLSQAQDQEVRAIRDYQISQIDLASATGTLLGAANVDWSPINGEK